MVDRILLHVRDLAHGGVVGVAFVDTSRSRIEAKLGVRALADPPQDIAEKPPVVDVVERPGHDRA